MLEVGEMMDRGRRLVARWEAAALAALPLDTELVDVHAHIGDDLDGMRGDADELLEMLSTFGVRQACCFCMNERAGGRGFRTANDRLLELGRLNSSILPFARLDLREDAVAEVLRCLAGGARGIKLHPRAQDFRLDHPVLKAVAVEAVRADVPILLHAGRGLPDLAASLGDLLREVPSLKLILAHAGLADVAGFTDVTRAYANIYFDTSAWTPVDVIACAAQIGTKRLLYASDYPYGKPPAALLLVQRVGRVLGWSDDDLRQVYGENARRLLHQPPMETAPAAPRTPAVLHQSIEALRVQHYVAMALSLFWTDAGDAVGAMDVAARAARGAASNDLAEVSSLLVLARDIWRATLDLPRPAGQYEAERLTSRLLHLAGVLSVDVPEMHVGR